VNEPTQEEQEEWLFNYIRQLESACASMPIDVNITGAVATLNKARAVYKMLRATPARVIAANAAMNYILEHGDERTMAPLIEQLGSAIRGKP
jgi:hypothetical protein